MNMEKLKNFNERATKALGGTTKNLWTKKDEDASASSNREARDTSAAASGEKSQVSIHLSAPSTDKASVSRGEREERAPAEQRRASKDSGVSLRRTSKDSGASLEVPMARPELRSETSETKPKRMSSSGSTDEMVMEQLSNMSQELANTKMAKQEVEAELKRLRADFEKLSAERDAVSIKAQQQEKELSSMKQAVVFESVEKGQLEVRKLRTDNVQLEARVAELAQTNSNLEKTLSQKSADLQKAKEQEAKLTSAMVDFRELQEKESKASTELAAARERLSNIDRNEETKLAAQRTEHERVLTELKAAHSAELKKLREDCGKLEETSGAFKRKAEGLAKDLKKRIEKDAKDDELKIENTRLKEEVQRKTKSLADAMQEILQGTSEGGGGASSQLRRDLEDAKRQLATLHEKEMTVEHLKSANGIMSQRIVDLESQLKALGVTPTGSRSLVTSSSAKGDRKDAQVPAKTPSKSSPKGAKQSDEDEELP